MKQLIVNEVNFYSNYYSTVWDIGSVCRASIKMARLNWHQLVVLWPRAGNELLLYDTILRN